MTTTALAKVTPDKLFLGVTNDDQTTLVRMTPDGGVAQVEMPITLSVAEGSAIPNYYDKDGGYRPSRWTKQGGKWEKMPPRAGSGIINAAGMDKIRPYLYHYVLADHVSVCGERKPNPYEERDETGRLINVHIAILSFGLNNLGMSTQVPFTYTYRVADRLETDIMRAYRNSLPNGNGKRGRDDDFHKKVPAGKILILGPGQDVPKGNYYIHESNLGMKFAIDLSCPEAFDLLINDSQKRQTLNPLTYALRNLTRRWLGGRQLVNLDERGVGKIKIRAWVPAPNVVKAFYEDPASVDATRTEPVIEVDYSDEPQDPGDLNDAGAPPDDDDTMPTDVAYEDDAPPMAGGDDIGDGPDDVKAKRAAIVKVFEDAPVNATPQQIEWILIKSGALSGDSRNIVNGLTLSKVRDAIDCPITDAAMESVKTYVGKLNARSNGK